MLLTYDRSKHTNVNIFMTKLLPVFKFAHQVYPKIPLSIMCAVFGIETSWGANPNFIKGNAVSNIKQKNAHEPFVSKDTDEYDKNGKKYTIKKERFRAYSTKFDSVLAYCEYIYFNERYSRCLGAENYIEFAQRLEDADYATVKDASGEKIYADKLIAIIEREKFYMLDM